jgi:excisionase family DNA binding protein
MAVHPSTSGGLAAVGSDRLLLNTTEAAKRLSIGRTKFYGLLRANVIPSLLLGGQRLVAHDDLVAYVDRLRADAQPYDRA